MDGLGNVYNDIDKYLKVREKIDVSENFKKRFFLGSNGGASRFETFFKRAPVSTHQICRIIQAAAAANNVVGLGDHDCVVTHCLRKSCT